MMMKKVLVFAFLSVVGTVTAHEDCIIERAQKCRKRSDCRYIDVLTTPADNRCRDLDKCSGLKTKDNCGCYDHCNWDVDNSSCETAEIPVEDEQLLELCAQISTAEACVAQNGLCDWFSFSDLPNFVGEVSYGCKPAVFCDFSTGLTKADIKTQCAERSDICMLTKCGNCKKNPTEYEEDEGEYERGTPAPTELTPAPTSTPAPTPTKAPTKVPTTSPTDAPTKVPTTSPTPVPTASPTPYGFCERDIAFVIEGGIDTVNCNRAHKFMSVVVEEKLFIGCDATKTSLVNFGTYTKNAVRINDDAACDADAFMAEVSQCGEATVGTGAKFNTLFDNLEGGFMQESTRDNAIVIITDGKPSNEEASIAAFGAFRTAHPETAIYCAATDSSVESLAFLDQCCDARVIIDKWASLHILSKDAALAFCEYDSVMTGELDEYGQQ